MKNATVTLLGNNSGRNLGDAAILATMLEQITERRSTVKFRVPALLPWFVKKNYGQRYNVKAVDVMPWTLSIRLLGLPTIYSLMKSDVAVICDGIIFGHKLLNPHNFLVTLFFLAPLCKLFNTKLVCLGCGIGPFPSNLSKRMARYVIDSCDLIVMRDQDSKELAISIGCKKDIHVYGDVAFVNKVDDAKTGIKILRDLGLDPDRPIFGINITKYLDEWLPEEQQMEDNMSFYDMYVMAINNIKQSIDGIQILILSCSPMDLAISEKLAKDVGGVVLSNTVYLSHEIQAAQKYCQAFIGMRFHSLVLTSAVGVPISGIVYSPKVRSLMKELGSEEYCIEMKGISYEQLESKLLSIWNNKEELCKTQRNIIEQIKERVKNSFSLFCNSFLN